MQLGWKEMWRQKRKFSMLFVITLLIVMLTTLITGLADGLAYDNGSALHELNASTYRLDKDSDGQLTRSFLDVPADSSIATMSVRPLTITLNGKKEEVTLFALPKGSDIGPVDHLQKGEVLYDSSLSENLRSGDVLTDFVSEYDFTIAGESIGRYSHGPVLYTTNETWFDYLRYSEQRPYVSAEIGTNHSASDTLMMSQQELIESVPGYSAEQSTFTMMRAFLLVIGTFILTAFFYLFTLQKLPELGILKAIGLSPRIIGQALLFQVIVIVSSAVVTSIGIMYIADAVIPSSMPFIVDIGHVLRFGFMFIILSILGALLPLWKLRQVDAIEIIGGKAS
ncbi:FtsX-like permease family protein [Exiguobacterium aestuarii]|uniref:Putative hemin transport system permease protein HrtB n=1 Tax=Exiguobacterium aestuarii TaxID=273527 RepID=A0ABW2PRA6_9BACL|nr:MULTISPECIES: ABC transporter permease [Exiguobacterium]MCT4786697.1 ABC transporter permease [Exiguobacterium aestuarii]